MKKQIIILIFFAFAMNLAFALNETLIKEQAFSCIKTSQDIMQEISEAGFNIFRINDSLKKAENLYEAQLILENQRKGTDFSSIIPYCQNIANIRTHAYKVKDELFSAKVFYNETSLRINMSEADLLLMQIEQEIQDERYEQALELIPELNKKIIEIQAKATTLNIFYEATTKSLTRFVKRNWPYILGLIVLVIILYFVYKKRIVRWLIKRKILNLQIEKETLRSLIKKTQYEYFQEGKISEGIYNIRTKKFAELIRDIDRQIPLLQEELEKISHEKVKSS